MPSDDVKNYLSPTCAEGTKLAIFLVTTLGLNDQLLFAFANICCLSLFSELCAASEEKIELNNRSLSSPQIIDNLSEGT